MITIDSLSLVMQEARLLESVGAHPNIVQLHGACLQQNLAMLVLEYMEVHHSSENHV